MVNNNAVDDKNMWIDDNGSGNKHPC